MCVHALKVTFVTTTELPVRYAGFYIRQLVGRQHCCPNRQCLITRFQFVDDSDFVSRMTVVRDDGHADLRTLNMDGRKLVIGFSFDYFFSVC